MHGAAGSASAIKVALTVNIFDVLVAIVMNSELCFRNLRSGEIGKP